MLNHAPGSLDAVLDASDRQVRRALTEGCGDAGHQALAEAVADVAGAFRYLAGVVEIIPEEAARKVIEKLHAERRGLKRGSGVVEFIAALGRASPVALAVVSISAPITLALWLYGKARGLV